MLPILLIIGLVFLVADALGKLPSWPWGLVLFLMLAGYGFGVVKFTP